MRFTVKGTTYVDSEHRLYRKGGLRGRIRLVTGHQELVLNLSSLTATERLIDHLWSAIYAPKRVLPLLPAPLKATYRFDLQPWRLTLPGCLYKLYTGQGT